MKSLAAFMVVCVLAAAALPAHAQTGHCSDGCLPACCSCDCCPRNYGRLEALFFTRDDGDGDQDVVIDTTSGDVLLSTGDLDFDFELGVSVLVGRQIDDCRAFEASYFGIYDWSAAETVLGANDLAIPGDLGLASEDFFDADRIRVSYSAELNNAELNYVALRDGYDLLIGFRYVSLNEKLNINSTDLDTGTSDYNIRTTNDLYGGQLGVRARGCRGGFDLEATAKAGIYANSAEQTQFVEDFPPVFFLRDEVSADDNDIAFVGDVNVSVVYPWTDTWSLRGGYSVLWIEGVALASNQLDFTNTPDSGDGIKSDGGLFAHGANLGLEARW